MMRDEGEFYVGYQAMPARLAHLMRTVAVALCLAAIAVGVTLGALQRRQPSGVFEYGVERTFEGVLVEKPVPSLRVDAAAGSMSFLLVGAGKHGLPPFARGHGGERVRFTGSLVYREGLTMVELNGETSFAALGQPTTGARTAVSTVGNVEVVGEIVDTKCYFGVMRPATGKVHRACAVRCLSGGVPPGLLLRTAGDDGLVLLLAGAPERPLALDPQWAARTARVGGTLELHDGVPLLRVARLELLSE